MTPDREVPPDVVVDVGADVGADDAAAADRSWPLVGPADPFGLHTLPFGVFRRSGRRAPGPATRVGVRVGDEVVDLTEAAEDLVPEHAALFLGGRLEPFLAAGRAVWDDVRALLGTRLARSWSQTPSWVLPLAEVRMHLPFTVADYVDFYSSEQHATNVGAIFRPSGSALPRAWKHLPIGYHGRAGTVVVSGTDVVRPSGLRHLDGEVAFGPSLRLDLEAEVAFVVGLGSRQGHPVPMATADEHVFGVCLLNDWSARDVQSFEYLPLGPFLGKSFATSLSPWVVPLAALDAARVAPPERDPRPAAYLDDTDEAFRGRPHGLDLRLEVLLDGHVVSRPPFASTYWTYAQQLAHLTVNGASLRTGDLYASGTVSGPSRSGWGSLLELSWGGAEPITLPDGSTRTFLADGDEVTVRATAPGPNGAVVGLGEVTGRVLPAVTPDAP